MKAQIKTWESLMKFGSKLGCHQRCDRSFYFKGYQFPVCARCTGAILTCVLSVPLYFVYKIPIVIAMVFSGILLIDWGLQRLRILKSTNTRRLITGIIGGLGWGTLNMYFFELILTKIIMAV